MTNIEQLFTEIDTLNQQRPDQVETGQGLINKEVLYSQRMRQCLQGFQPAASEELQIAAYSQHVQRWAIPRSDYPMNKAGYKQWRTTLGQFHARTTGSVMEKLGYPQASIERVQYLLQKKGLKKDPETQTLEDVICLVFMEYYLEAFAAKHSEDKLIGIIQKTWRKMSAAGHEQALKLPLPPTLTAVIKKALNL